MVLRTFKIREQRNYNVYKIIVNALRSEISLILTILIYEVYDTFIRKYGL